MDYSATNTGLWNPIIQIFIICAVILIANILHKKVPLIRNTMMPIAVLAGFLLLIAKSVGLVHIDTDLFEMLTYHCIAIGFIALSLRVPEGDSYKDDKVGVRSGAIIVGSYMIQGIVGLVISITLSYTLCPGLFKACGILLPMGYGQGPGQANNIGSSYEGLGFAGGQAFGLALAAAGYLSACIVGVLYMNYLVKKGKLNRIDHEEISGSVTVDTFQHKNELPIAESLDRLSIQVALILAVYGVTYLLTWGLTSAFTAISEGLGKTLNSLLWGFNFMIGSGLAIALRALLKKLNSANVVKHQYQNNYLLSRISGLAFDIMIVAGIASIEFDDLSGLWLPFILMAVAGAIVTLIHLRYVCKRVYGDYYYEGLLSMYGMMTGTISSGILLLREIDPQLKTPAANNLVIGSSFAILFGIPLLVLVSLAPQSTEMTFVTLGLVIIYYIFLMFIACHRKKNK